MLAKWNIIACTADNLRKRTWQLENSCHYHAWLRHHGADNCSHIPNSSKAEKQAKLRCKRSYLRKSFVAHCACKRLVSAVHCLYVRHSGRMWGWQWSWWKYWCVEQLVGSIVKVTVTMRLWEPWWLHYNHVHDGDNYDHDDDVIIMIMIIIMMKWKVLFTHLVCFNVRLLRKRFAAHLWIARNNSSTVTMWV